jgi:hypothetical protein
MNLNKVRTLAKFLVIPVGVAFASLRYVPTQDPGEKADVLLKLLYQHKDILPFVLGGLVVFLQLLATIEPSLNRRNAKRWVELMEARYTKKSPGVSTVRLRVSLFRPSKWYQIFRWGMPGKKLVLYQRSGEMNQKSKNSWSIEDSIKGTGDGFDGPVGKAWATRLYIRIPNLPDIEPNAGKKFLNEYISQSHIKRDKIDKLSWRSRSFLATIVKNKKNDEISVLLFESLDPEGLDHIEDSDLDVELKVHDDVIAT